MRLGGLIALAGLLLQGCGTTPSHWDQYFTLMRQSVQASFGTQSISLDQAAAIPYATLGYRINGGSQAMLVLASDTNGDLLWTAASRVVFLTRGGRLVRTVGLPHDRAGMTPQNGQSLPALGDAIRGAYRSSRMLDMPSTGTYASVSCTTSAKGRQLIRVLGTGIPTVRIDEVCVSRNPRWSFTDSYWIDPDNGFAWRSIQHLHPSGVTVQIDVLRPPE